jgi:uncharacterized membrane protein
MGEPGRLVGNRTTMPALPSPAPRNRLRIPSWWREALRTNLWVVPTALVAVAAGLWFVSYQVDRQVYQGNLTLPGWINRDTADAARQVLSAIAAAVITVVGVVFSITIVALTLASQQFGPRMLRSFIRDKGNQYTLGTFVGTFVYAVLTLGSITSESRGDFVPHVGITVALGLTLLDLGVLIYFIHHVAKSIQLPQVVAGIAADLSTAVDTQILLHAMPDEAFEGPGHGPSLDELMHRLATEGCEVPAPRSGYLQFISRQRLIRVAAASNSVVRFLHRPGHFLVQGRPLAVVWPRTSAPQIARAFRRVHAIGPQRTLTQDILFAIDQLVEIAIRAISPAVNDPFSALTCIDWLGANLARLSSRSLPTGVYRDSLGQIRLIEPQIGYARVVNRAFDKIRQSGRGMPAILIRQLETLAIIAEATRGDEERQVLRRQADMVLHGAEESIPEEGDRADVRVRYKQLLDLLSDEPAGTNPRR